MRKTQSRWLIFIIAIVLLVNLTVLTLDLCYSRVFCTHMADFKLKKTFGSASEDALFDEITLQNFTITGGAPGLLGRCFIEV